MANLKELRTRKASVESTRKVTQAMQLLSAIKSKKLHALLAQRDIYITELRKTISLILAERITIDHPLLTQSESIPTAVTYIVIASNRGFVGPLLSHLTHHIQNETQGLTEQIHYIGVKPTAKKVFSQLGVKPDYLFDDICDENVFELAGTLKLEIFELLKANPSQKIALVYTDFKSFAKLLPTTKIIAPLKLEEEAQGEHFTTPYSFDSSPEELLKTLIEEYLEAIISHALLSAAVSEYAARMIAMHKAKENADQVLLQTTRAYNKARQEAITTQIQEIANTQLISLSL